MRKPSKNSNLSGILGRSKTLLTVAAAAIAVLYATSTLADTASMIALQRDAVTKDNVYQASYVLSALATDVDTDGYYEAPVMLTGAGPTGGGFIPTNSGAPLSDGYSNALGYCSFDNGTTNSSTGRITGTLPASNAKPTLVVISAGPDGVFDTTCATIYAGGVVSNDDYAVSKSAVQVAGGVSGTTDVGKSADSLATLNSLDSTALVDGQMRLVKENNTIYRWNSTLQPAGAWEAIAGTLWSGTGSAIYYTGGNVGIGAAFSSTNLPLAKLHVSDQARFDAGINVNGNTFVDASRNVTANNLTFVDTTGNRVQVHSAGYGIGMNTNDMSVYVPSNGTFSVRQGGFNGTQLLTVNGNTGALGLNGVRAISLDPNSGVIAIRGDAGGWSNGLSFVGSGGTYRGGFGALGWGDGLSNFWIGSGHATPWMTFSSTANNSLVALQENGNQVLHAGNYSTYALPLTGGTITGALAVNGFINTGSGYQVGGVTVIDSSRNIGNVGNIYFAAGSNNLIGQVASVAHSSSNVGSVGFGINDGGGNTGVFVHNTHNGTFSSQDIRFFTHQGGISVGERMRLDATGYLGIGTSSPQARLDVAGNAIVSGNLTVSGNQVLHAGNFSSYALPLTGGTLSGALQVNSTITAQSTTDAQLNLNGNGTSWAGISWTDVSGTDYTYYNGSTGTFAIGGGGSVVAGKKLHVHGGMTIGSGLAGTGNPTNGLSVEGSITAPSVYVAQTSYVLPLNAGDTWIRLASGSGNSYGRFHINWASSSQHGFLDFTASCNYPGSGQCTINASHMAEHYLTGIKQIRMVRGDTYAAYYLEVLVGNNGGDSNRLTFTAKELTSFSMLSPAVGGIPSGYTAHTVNVENTRLALGNGAFAVNTDGSSTFNGPLSVAKELIVNGQTSGSAGNRIIVGAATPQFTLQDGNLRPTIQATGQYPVLSLNHTVTSNSNHGPTVQFTANGVGKQFVIGMTGNGTALDFGFSSAADWNPHNGIAGYNGTTPIRIADNGYVGIGGSWGNLSGQGNPQYPVDIRGNTNVSGSLTAANVTIGANGALNGNYGTWTGEANKIQWHSNNLYFQNTGGGHFVFRRGDGANIASIDNGGSLSAIGDMRAPIFYDSNDTGYYVDPNGTSRMSVINSGDSIRYDRDVSTDNTFGMYFGNNRDANYGIYRESGAWNSPYPDLRIAFHTGIKIGAHASYGGTRFFTNSDMATEIMSVGNGDTNVRVANTLIAGNVNINANGRTVYAANSSWGALLYVGGDGVNGISRSDLVASVNTTNGNLHLDAGTNRETFLNWYSGSGGVNIGNGANGYGTLRAGNVTIAGNQVLHAGNYSSYALPLTGGTVTGVTYFRSNKGAGAYVGASDTYALQAFSNDGGAAGMSFHRGGYYAVNMGLDPDNVLRIGGWSAAANRWQLDMAGNQTVAGHVRAGTNIYTDANYGYGLVGAYSASRYQGVYAMGDAYKLPADGTSTGNLYGLAWSHPNAGGVAANLSSHGLLVMENGGFLAAISGSIRAKDDMRAPIFYDSNDTGYYVDPNAASNLNTVKAYAYRGNGNVAGTGEASFHPAGIYSTGTNWLYGTMYLNSNNIEGVNNINAASFNGLAIHGGRNNEANKIVRTDATGYIQAGWINTPSGDIGDWGNGLTKFYASSDDYIRYVTRNAAKVQLGLTGKWDGDRRDYTANSDYFTGAMGWGNTDMNTVGDWGSGFFDTWGSPGNSPGDTSHYVGVQAFHYSTGSTRFGWQMAGGPTSRPWYRQSWPSFGAWQRILTDVNDPYAYNMNQYVRTTDSPTFAGMTIAANGALYGNYGAWTGETNKIQWHSNNLYFQNTGGGQFLFRRGDGANMATIDNAGSIYGAGSITAGTHIRAGTNVYTDANYGYGLVGAYASTRYQGIYAMGEAYKLPADGTTTGSLYGLAWAHPNAGGVAGNLNTHGLLVMENGNFLAAISGSIRARDDMRAPVFYDSNDTGYYVDPNGTSRLNGVNVVGTVAAGNVTIGGNQVLHAGNYNSYAPTLTGGGASGTWGINVTGSAATASNLVSAAGIIQSTSLGTAYSTAIQVREVSGYGSNSRADAAPRLGFHWAGIVASSISMGADGHFYLNDNPGTSREDLYLRHLNASGNIAAGMITTGGAKLTGNWTSSGTGYPEQLTIRGTYPSLALRATNGNQVWLMHNDGASGLHFYGANDGNPDSYAWADRFHLANDGKLIINGGVATFNTTAITFTRDLYMNGSRIADADGYIYAANTATEGYTGCTAGQIAKNSRGELLVCQ